MTALLYYSISSDLTEDEIIQIDSQVGKNRKAIYFFIMKLPSNCKGKVKLLLLNATFIVQLSQPLIPHAAAAGMSAPVAGIHQVVPSRVRASENYSRIATIPESKVGKIQLTNQQIEQFNNFALQINNGSMTMEDVVLQIRGGDGLTDLCAVIAFVVFVNWYDSVYGVQGFQTHVLPHHDLVGWLTGKYDSKNIGPSGSRPMTRLEMQPPSSMPHRQYSDLTKSEKRQLPDPLGRDRYIDIDGYPRLDLRFNQVAYKTPKHGKDHGLAVGENTKTPKTEANFIALRDSLLDMPNKEDVIWYRDGQYQGGTKRGCNSVNVFDPNTEIISVYEKKPDGTNLFLTTVKLQRIERDHLEFTKGNFVTAAMLDQQNWVKPTPIDNSQLNNP